VNQLRAVLEMHERENSYSKISIVLGIPCTCNDIVQRFGMK
jgi:hypothetical protein